MKQISRMAGLIIGLVLYSTAQADARIDGLKQMNAQGCARVIKYEENGPKDPRQAKPYCTCVYDVYYDGFSQKERNDLFADKPVSDKDGKKLQDRLAAAKAQCRQKIGF